MLRLVKRGLKSVAKRLGRTSAQREEFPPDFDAAAIELYRFVQPYTMTSKERIFTLQQSVQYIARHGIPGDIVECGVWKGGSMMAIARTLQQQGDRQRHLHLFDTFEGMAEPTSLDTSLFGEAASDVRQRETKNLGPNARWVYSPLEEVKQNLSQTGYDLQRLSFIKGKVEDTLPAHAPSQIALLRLDTDWYESTYHELVHLYPRLSVGGVLIIDDYGHWAGARKAVDQYFAEHRVQVLLQRVDYTARMGVKLAA